MIFKLENDSLKTRKENKLKVGIKRLDNHYHKMSKKYLILGGLFLIIIIIIIAISSGGEKKTETTVPTQGIQEEELEALQEAYFIDFDISLEGREITLTGNTNIPNESLLSVGIHRYVEYFDETMQEPLSGKRVVDFENAKIKVQDGKFNYSTFLTDKEWYDKDLAENEAIGMRLTKIYEDCYVSLTFTPARNLQPGRVYKILGNKFEKMKGEQVEESGIGNVIQVSKDFKLPVEEGVVAQ